MDTFTILSTNTGERIGTFRAGSREQALDRMAESFGFQDHKALMANVKGYSLRDLEIYNMTGEPHPEGIA